MAEVLGLVIGFAGLFNTVVDDFKYIQFARNFGADFQVNVLQLSNAQLRLSRWGKSIGLSDIDGETQSLRGTLLSGEDIRPAHKLLSCILDELQKAKDKSAEYAKDKKLGVYDPENDLGYSDLSLLAIGRNLVRSRQNGMGKTKKAKWALYDRGHFKEMIENVTKLTGELVELFPAAKEKQGQLRDEEMTAFTGSLRQLQAAIANQDEMLAMVLSQLLNPAVSYSFLFLYTCENSLTGINETDIHPALMQSETFNFEMKGGQVAQQGKNTGQIHQTVHNR